MSQQHRSRRAPTEKLVGVDVDWNGRLVHDVWGDLREEEQSSTRVSLTGNTSTGDASVSRRCRCRHSKTGDTRVDEGARGSKALSDASSLYYSVSSLR